MTVLNLLRDQNRIPDRVVIIDVFRSSNTIIELLHQGAMRVIPVLEENEARDLKKENPEWQILGERKGVMLPGFDGDNSPSGLPLDITGRTVVLTTSGGTRCIAACPDQSKVYIGSFANASAIINILAASSEATAFWSVGQSAEKDAAEDILCAHFLDARLAGEERAYATVLEKVLSCEGADRLRQLDQNDDLKYCTDLDSRTIVPKRRRYGALWSIEA
jgi:2-phosphosulfolactate phosphatase